MFEENYVPPEPKIKIEELLHEATVTREIAKQILENFRHENGCYLIRRTQRNEHILVLSLMFNAEFFNYEICIREPSPALSAPQRHFYIDDGPYFRTLSHLVEHYSKYEDGLPGLLLRPIRPNSVNNNNGTVSHPLLTTTNDLIRGSVKTMSQQKQTQHLLQPSSTNVNSSSSSSSSSSSVSNTSTSQALILNQLIKVSLAKDIN